MLITYGHIEKYDDLSDVCTFLKHHLNEAYQFFAYSIFYTKYNKYCYIAKINTQLVGVVLAKTEACRYGYIGMFAVDKQYRRKGIGTRLLDMCLQSFFENRIYDIVLETEYDNYAAIRLYEKCGFIKVNFFKNYYLNNKHAFRLQY
ncbi:N-alpha-acetyltransferase 30, partial [Conglomerata obtusa]